MPVGTLVGSVWKNDDVIHLENASSSGGFEPHLTHGSLGSDDPQTVYTSQTASPSVQPFFLHAQFSTAYPTHTQILLRAKTRQQLHATSISSLYPVSYSLLLKFHEIKLSFFWTHSMGP